MTGSTGGSGKGDGREYPVAQLVEQFDAMAREMEVVPLWELDLESDQIRFPPRCRFLTVDIGSLELLQRGPEPGFILELIGPAQGDEDAQRIKLAVPIEDLERAFREAVERSGRNPDDLFPRPDP